MFSAKQFYLYNIIELDQFKLEMVNKCTDYSWLK